MDCIYSTYSETSATSQKKTHGGKQCQLHGEGGKKCGFFGYLARGFDSCGFLFEYAGVYLTPSVLAAENTVAAVPHETIVACQTHPASVSLDRHHIHAVVCGSVEEDHNKRGIV